MKIPKKVRRYCKFCKKHTEQKINIVGGGRARGALKRGSPVRARKRGLARGYGSHGKWPPSKPAVTEWKRKTKSTKKMNLLFTCVECGKSTTAASKRTGKLVFKE